MLSNFKVGDTVAVKPLSSKAKNRFANVLGKNPNCVVEQIMGDKVRIVSENREYWCWVNPISNTDWEITLNN